MSEALVIEAPVVGESDISAVDRYSAAVDTFLESTRQIFKKGVLDLVEQDRMPSLNVDITRRGESARESHHLLRIPGRLEPGESVVVNRNGELLALRQSGQPGAFDGDTARFLRSFEVITFAPSVLRQMNLQLQDKR